MKRMCVILLLSLLLGLTACGEATPPAELPPTPPAPEAPAPEPQQDRVFYPEKQENRDPVPLTLYVNDLPVALDLRQEGATWDCPMLHTEFETEFRVEEGGREIAVNGQPLEEGELSLQLETLDARTNLDLEIDGKHYSLRTLPADFPRVEARGQGEQGGFYYTTLGGYVIKMDHTGQVVFYKRAPAFCAGPFRRTEVEGQVLYSYLQFRPSADHPALQGVGVGQTCLVVLDEQYHLVEEVPFLAETDKVPANYPLENHDHLVLGPGHYVLVTYVGKRVNNIPRDVPGWEFGANVAACIFQEIVDGECVFEWDATDHPELYGASVEGGDFANTTNVWADYAHINAIAIDPRDGNFLCSFRNLDCVLKIHRTTGEILWILGGKLDQFGLTPEQQFHRQHNVGMDQEGNLTLFDNGCLFGIAPYPAVTQEEKAALDHQQISRGLELRLDEENRTVTGWKAYPLEQFFSNAMGSMQMLNRDTETVLLCWGQKIRPGMPLFSEVNYQTQQVNFELFGTEDSHMCYRVTWYPA